MSTVIVVGPEGSPPESTSDTASVDIASTLGELGCTVVDLPARASRQDVALALADVPAGQRVALVDRRFVGHRHALRLALVDPRFEVLHLPGVLTVDAPRRATLRAELAPRTPAPATAATGAPERAAAEDEAATPPGENLPDQLAARFAHQDATPPHQPELGELVAEVPTNPERRETALRAVAAVDDERVRLRRAVKSRDGFFTTYCVSPYSRYLARWCARRGLTPNQVTTGSLLVALLAAGSAATGTRLGFLAAGALLLASFVLDCTDGQLARYTLRYSTLGAWLDATFDRVKEYAYYAGLAVGAIAYDGHRVWGLALGALVLQTVRHIVDFSFNEANQGAAGTASSATKVSDRLDAVGWTIWARRIVVLPIGERWALLAVLTAASTPRITFLVLLIGCALAGCYTTAGRLLRSLRHRQRRDERCGLALRELSDSGPLAVCVAQVLRPLARRLPGPAAPAVALLGTALLLAALYSGGAGRWWSVGAAAVYVLAAGLATAHPLRRSLDWLVPPIFRAGEYLTVLALAVLTCRTVFGPEHAADAADRALPAAFGLVAAVAYHHYDTVYRIRGGTDAPPRWLGRAIGGHEGRVLVLTAAAAAICRWSGDNAAGALQAVLVVLTLILALTVLTESIRFWMSGAAPAVHDETGETT